MNRLSHAPADVITMEFFSIPASVTEGNPAQSPACTCSSQQPPGVLPSPQHGDILAEAGEICDTAHEGGDKKYQGWNDICPEREVER